MASWWGYGPFKNLKLKKIRVMKTVIFFEKVDPHAKYYCPEGFYSVN